MPTTKHILRLRLNGQLIEHPAGPAQADPATVVAHLGAMQAQDYPGALWSVGLRCAPGTTSDDVEAAIAERRIVRTWLMRGTLHFAAPEDVRWMLRLLAPRAIARSEKRFAQLGLTDEIFDRSRELITGALEGGNEIARLDAMALLEAEGISTEDQRGYHILWRLAHDGLICCGPKREKQQTFVLLDEWIPKGTALQDSPSNETALARLAERYFAARGPATIADFSWWAGIPKGDANEGLGAIAHRLESLTYHGAEYWLAQTGNQEPGGKPHTVHLLPGFDEYMLGYTDRSAQLGEHRRTYGSSVSANGMFSATLVIDGLIAGTWRRTLRNDHVDVAVRPFRPLTSVELSAIDAAVEEYGQYKGLKPVLHVTDEG